MLDGIILVARDKVGQRHELTPIDGRVTIGRTPTNDLVLDDVEVSRHHAEIRVQGDSTTIVDLGSKNGTWVNDEAVTSPHELRYGDVVRFGALAFDVVSAAGETQTRSIGRARPPDKTATVLFTDLQGHTALFERLGTDAAYATVSRHISIMRDEVARRGGTIVKTEGDGVIATFASVRDAVLSAVAIQRETSALEAPIPVRAGINTGDAIHEDDDVLGLAVIKASRAMSHAAGGEILLTEVSRMLLGPVADLQLTSRGWFVLKGVSRRERLYEVAWRPTPVDSGQPSA